MSVFFFFLVGGGGGGAGDLKESIHLQAVFCGSQLLLFCCFHYFVSFRLDNVIFKIAHACHVMPVLNTCRLLGRINFVLVSPFIFFTFIYDDQTQHCIG